MQLKSLPKVVMDPGFSIEGVLTRGAQGREAGANIQCRRGLKKLSVEMKESDPGQVRVAPPGSCNVQLKNL